MSTVVLESRPFRPFKSSEEYLYAMKEDLAEWFQMLYPHLRINVENFMDRLETGVALCEASVNKLEPDSKPMPKISKPSPAKEDISASTTPKDLKQKKIRKTKRFRAARKLRLDHIIDAVSTTLLTKKQLRKYCRRVLSDNVLEKKQAATFKMERDRIRVHWGISRIALEEVKVKFRNAESYFEETMERCEIELDGLKHKALHVFYDQKNELAELSIDTLTHLKLAFDTYTEQECNLRKDKRNMFSLNTESVSNSKQCLKFLRLEHAGQIHQLRQLLTQELFEMDQIFDRKITGHSQMLEERHCVDVAELAERKEREIEEVLKNNDEEMDDLQTYYSDIALNNWALIATLKSKMEVLRGQNECISTKLQEVMSVNQYAVSTIEKSQQDVARYKKNLKYYKRDQALLANAKNETKAMKNQLSRLQWQHMALEMRVEMVEAEKKVLEERLFKAILEVERRTAVKTALMDAKIGRMRELNEVRHSVIGELKSMDEKPRADNKILARILDDKDDQIHTIKYELARVRKAHHDLLLTYEDKMAKYKVPQTNLSFVPLRILPKLLTVKKSRRVSFIGQP